MQDRNAESHFGHIEPTNIKRSMFNLLFRNLSTCNAGKIIPFLAYPDILPGDTISAKTSAVVRMQTPLNPTMDDAFVDTYYFAIPHRLVWTHWKEFMGENKDSAWISSTQYQVPKLTTPTGGAVKGTIMDYMGIPKGVAGLDFQALPIRAYVLTYNTWFRNQNLIAPATEYDDDTNRTASNTTTELGGLPFNAAKIADYFTTCLPEPQKGTATPIPLGSSAPVYAGIDQPTPISKEAIHFKVTNGSLSEITAGSYNMGLLKDNDTDYGYTSFNATNTTGEAWPVYPSNLYTDLTQATAATINALRLYFQVQRLKELGGRAGTRYFEVLKSEFGTAPSMTALQYPEYLGGKRTPLDLTQIVQNSTSTGSTAPLGWTGGMSHTAFSNEDFTKSFQEHCILLGVMVIRQYHTYQQGLARFWSRLDKLDYYTPMLAHLGEQPVYKKEIMATGNSESDNAVFGYQERWAEYKYGQQIITGEMNSTYATSLDVWHYGDEYASVPTLAQNWIEETSDYIDRTLAVSQSVADQFKFDIVTNITATRAMPVYCTPGLIDHF